MRVRALRGAPDACEIAVRGSTSGPSGAAARTPPRCSGRRGSRGVRWRRPRSPSQIGGAAQQLGRAVSRPASPSAMLVARGALHCDLGAFGLRARVARDAHECQQHAHRHEHRRSRPPPPTSRRICARTRVNRTGVAWRGAARRGAWRAGDGAARRRGVAGRGGAGRAWQAGAAHLLHRRDALAPRVGGEEGVVALPVARVGVVERAGPLGALGLAPGRGTREAARHRRARDALGRAVAALGPRDGAAARALVGVGAERAVAAPLRAGRATATVCGGRPSTPCRRARCSG